MNTKKTYVDEEGKIRPYPAYGQGYAEPATPEDLARDELGFTNPNLHRRVEPKESGRILPEEISNREYKLLIQKFNSYRAISYTLHDEDSTEIEIP